MVWRNFRDMGDLSPVFQNPVGWADTYMPIRLQAVSAVDTGESTPRISAINFAVARSRLVFLELASPPRPVLEPAPGAAPILGILNY